MSDLLIFVLVIVFSFLLTGLIRYYAIKKNIVDIPNQRSSHTTSTPLGGGVSIVITFIVASSLLNNIPIDFYWSLLISSMVVTVIGFIDDRNHIDARWRLLVHFIGAAWVLILLGGLPPLTIFNLTLDFGYAGYLLSIICLVWLLNLYNFMDGINGIAAIEAITVCLGGAVFYGLSLTSGSEWKLLLLLMAAVVGFLFWNFPKARIFMGDAGSGFLGLVFGVFSIQAAWIASELLWSWLILLGAFIVDATVTLLRRILRGEKFYEAHRSHAYQYASRRYHSHYPVSLFFGAVNLLWLLPIGVLVTLGRLDGLPGLVIAYTPLVWLAFYYKAGAPEQQET